MTSSDPETEPATESAATPGPRARWRRALVAPVVLAVATLVVALLVPLAPVRVTDPVLSWPFDPAQPRSSLALFMPYRPLQLDVTVPCRVLRGDSASASDTPDVTVFSTYPPGPDRLTRGLTVLDRPDGFRVTSSGLAVYDGPVPPGDCVVEIATTTESTGVLSGGVELARRRIDPPQVTAFATDLSPEAARGLSATAHADARFESSPTPVKRVLLAIHVLLVAGCLWLLGRADRATRGDQGTSLRPMLERVGRGLRPRLPDAAVLGVLGLWTVIGPFTDDDGYYAAMSRGSSDTGYVGNYYHWLNAPEAPFELVQRLLSPWVGIRHSTVWLRFPSLVAVFGVWLIVTRGVLPRLLGRPTRVAEQWLASAVLLAWALPYGIGVRPEPWVALATVAVLGLVLRALATHTLVSLGLAAAMGATAVAITPSGLMALTPLLAYGRPLYRMLRDRPGGIWRSSLPVIACGTVALAVIFVDASLGAVLEATRIHDEIGPSLQWWQENTRYNYLFSFISMGSFAKRLPVLLAFAVVLLVMVLRERAGTTTERQSSRAVAAGGPALAFGISIGVLWLTPSKWTHHFGALIGLGTVVTVLMLADLPATLRAHRVSRLSMAAITFVFSVVVALSFAGPNSWFGYSQYGVNEYLSPRLSSPWLWIAAGVATAAATSLLVPRTRRRQLTVALEHTPLAVVLLALLASIVLCVGTFVHSAVKLRGTWSIAKENTDHLTGSSCGMGDYTQVLTYGKLTPTGSTEPFFGNGFSADGAVYPPPVTPAEAGLPMWGSYVNGFGPGREWYTGEYASPWYELPPLDDRSDISVLVTGRLFDGNKLTVEYAKSDETVVGQRVLRDFESTAGWRELVAADPTLAPAGTELLRLRLNDASVDGGGWLAATAPRLRTGGQSFTDVIGAAPTLADWPIAIAFPCLRPARLQHGLVEPPAFVLNSDFLAAHNSRDEKEGGTFVPAYQAANGGVVVPSRVEGMPAWITRWLGPWGTLTQYHYPYPADGYRLELRHRTMSGAAWSYQQPIEKPVDELRQQEREGSED